MMPDWDRRGFLIAGGAATAGALVAGALGRTLLEGRAAGPAAGEVLPPVTAGGSPRPESSLPAGSELDVAGITPLVVPNDRFYRIDTALIVPRVDASTWDLRVTGMVDQEVRLTYEDLRAMPLFDQYVTIACVSNEVGGSLVGNALWTGVHLRDVLAMAGVQTGATQIVGRSVDGFTAGFPTAWAMDPARDPMIAIGMNGEPLPADHGYPARLIIPGLYGYVSATKWLGSIELTTWEGFDAYWIPLGWAKEGPILTQSRIDVPRDRARVVAGPVTIAGVAWAPDRGVDRVEVKVDDQEWVTATTSTPLSDATWVQWLRVWDATPGRHTILVRATDGTGEVQTADVTRPAPDGARGHHTIEIEVSEA
jgi:DMSO/TMAO reductase YedYZ molybdopterin-dependent catalytic subunit